MGVRSAVIAVATAMQESMLQNIDYGTGTALGLFQQQPDSGWGTPTQVTNPVYAARAFLSALQRHQASDPAWARQPLWANAQSVQNSAFPAAYAKWETQAASLVRHIAVREAHAEADRREPALITQLTTVSGPGLPLLPPATADRTARPPGSPRPVAPGSPTRQAGACAPPSPRGRGTIHRTVILPR